MQCRYRSALVALAAALLAGCSGAPGEAQIRGEARWEADIAAPATLTVELVPRGAGAELPVFSTTQPLEAEARRAEFVLPFDEAVIDEAYRLSARLDHDGGLLLGRHDGAVTLAAEGHRFDLHLERP